MIEIKDLRKQFGPIPALQGIDVKMNSGQVTVIAGPNGSGKTTLIKTILGLVKPDSGEIRLNGAILNGDHQYRSAIGYMPQVGHFPENLRGLEVLELVTSVRADSPIGDNRLLQSLKLGGEMSKKVSALSGGTRQKLSAVVAFLFNPGILILDEPTGGLDPTSGAILKQEILRARKADSTVVLTTHIMSEIEELADRIVFLCEGRVLFTGSKPELLQRTGESTIEAAFGRLADGGAA